MPPVSSQHSAEQPEAGPSTDPVSLPEPPPFWSLKPWWCQPWSILSFGIAVVIGSWMLLNRLWITLPLSLAVLAWWGLFLVLVPTAYRQEARLNQP